MSYEKFALESALEKLHIDWVRPTGEITTYKNLSLEFIQESDFTPSAMFQELFSYGKKLYFDTAQPLEEMRKSRLMNPFLYEAERHHPKLRIWEGVSIDADARLGLTGEPDYCVTPYDIAPKTPYCVIMEAKREDFAQGWGQALAAMRGAQILNRQKLPKSKRKTGKESAIYGVVSTGSDWQFGKLKSNQYLIYPPATINVLKSDDDAKAVLGLLDIIFKECEKNLRRPSQSPMLRM
jgi:hypothetical protein